MAASSDDGGHRSFLDLLTPNPEVVDLLMQPGPTEPVSPLAPVPDGAINDPCRVAGGGSGARESTACRVAGGSRDDLVGEVREPLRAFPFRLGPAAATIDLCAEGPVITAASRRSRSRSRTGSSSRGAARGRPSSRPAWQGPRPTRWGRCLECSRAMRPGVAVDGHAFVICPTWGLERDHTREYLRKDDQRWQYFPHIRKRHARAF